MNKILAFAASAAVVVLATSGADAESSKPRAPRGVHGHHGYGQNSYLQYLPSYLQYLPRLYPGLAPRFDEGPMFVPDAPFPRYYGNPGVPDFEDGPRG
jgi:hypothetical protein